MEEFEVRRSCAEDLSQVDALLMRSYPVLLKPDYPASVLVTAIPRMVRANPGLLASDSYYVAVGEDGVIIGCGGWSVSGPRRGRRSREPAQVRHFGTDPGRVREGVGAAIMGCCLRDAGEHGIHLLECISTRTAVPFYRAQGFRKIRDLAMQLAPGIEFPAVLMTRAI